MYQGMQALGAGRPLGYNATEGPTQPVSAVSAVQCELEAIGHRLNELNEALSNLDSRLSPVLLPSSPDAQQGQEKSTQSRGFVVDALTNINSGLAVLQRRVQQISDRLAV